MSAILRMPGLDAIGGMADRGRLANLMFGMGDLNNNGKLDLDDATTIKTNMDVDGEVYIYSFGRNYWITVNKNTLILNAYCLRQINIIKSWYLVCNFWYMYLIIK